MKQNKLSEKTETLQTKLWGRQVHQGKHNDGWEKDENKNAKQVTVFCSPEQNLLFHVLFTVIQTPKTKTFLPCFLTLPALQRKVEKQSQNIFQKMGTQTSLYLGGKGNCCNPSFPRCHSKASGILNTRTCLGLLRCVRFWTWQAHQMYPSPKHLLYYILLLICTISRK